MNVRGDGIRSLVKELGAPGAAVYVIAPGFDEGVAEGVCDPRGRTPFTVDSALRVASNTKTFVALALTRLSRKGGIELDGSLESVLPGELADVLGARYDLGAITPRMLLTHSSGLRCHTDDPSFLHDIRRDPQRRWLRLEQVERAVALGPPVSGPGERGYYSDTGYVILGAILERLTGLYLGPALRTLIDYNALGLESIWFETQEPPPDGVSLAHQWSGDLDTTRWDPSMDLYGGGGLMCSARDLARFFSLLPRQPEIGEMLRTPVSPSATELRAGLFERRIGGRTVLSHAGYWGTVAQVVPEAQLAIGAAVTQREAAKALQDVVDALTEELV